MDRHDRFEVWELHRSDRADAPSLSTGARCLAGGSAPHLQDRTGNRWGYGEAERLGGLEVYDHLELGRKLHREIALLRVGRMRST